MIAFATTPLFRALGLFRYHSRYVYSVGNSLHLDLTRDLFRPRRDKRELARDMRAGFANFLDTRRPGAQVTVETWFLSPRRMERLGFRRERPSIGARIEMILGYPDVLLSQWLVLGRLRWFNPWKVQRYSLYVDRLRLRLPGLRSLAA